MTYVLEELRGDRHVGDDDLADGEVDGEGHVGDLVPAVDGAVDPDVQAVVALVEDRAKIEIQATAVIPEP